MSARTFQTGSGLPALELPPAALSPEDAQYNYNPETDLPAIEPIEHKLRVDLMTAGVPESKDQLLPRYNMYQKGPDDGDPWKSRMPEKPLAVRYVERTIERQWESEQRYFDEYESDAVLKEAPAYLQHQLRACRTKPNPETAVKQERENRKSWYDLMPFKNLYPIFTQNSLGGLLNVHGEWVGADGRLNIHSSRHADAPVTYVGIVVVPNSVSESSFTHEHGIDEGYVYKEEKFASQHDTEIPTPTDYGIELPAPLLMGEYASGSCYLFIPWCSGLVCQGPFKTERPYRVACKHEALAAFILSQSDQDTIFLPVDEGIDVPARARRFIDPKIATSHAPEP